MNEKELTQAVSERLKFIEMTLRFRGRLKRADLAEKFSISLPAATRDLREYRELCPENTVFNSAEKLYELNTSSFEPMFNIGFNEAVGYMRNSSNSKAIGFQEHDSIQSPPRLSSPDLNVWFKFTRAILNKRVIITNYWSVKNGLSEKKLAPHSLIDNGLRWHLRAFDYEKDRFADFVLTRFKSVEEVSVNAESPCTREHDRQWNRFINLELVPHPSLDNVPHKETLMYDFGMDGGVKLIEVRAAVAGYWLSRWNIDCSEDHKLKGGKYQLWLRNSMALYDVESAFMAPGYEK